MKNYLQRVCSTKVDACQAQPDSRRQYKKRRNWIFCTHGNAITEFALTLPLFILMMCGVADLARLFYVETTLQNAVRQGGRYASTGNHQPDPLHAGQTLSRVNSIIFITQQAALGLNISNLQISSAVGGSGNAGGPLDTVTLSLTNNVRLLTPIIANFFPNGSLSVTVKSTFKNEPFPPGQTI